MTDQPADQNPGLAFLRESTRGVGQLRRVHKTKLAPCPGQPRRSFDAAALDELRQTMEVQQAEPIVAYKADSSGTMMIRMGERRWRAAQLSETITELDVIELPFAHEDEPRESRLVAQAVENVQREPLNVIDWALTVEELVRLIGDRKEVAKVIGKDTSYISRLLSVLSAPASVRELAEENIVTDAKTLATLRRAFEVDEPRTLDLISRARSGAVIDGGLRSEAEAIVKLSPGKRKGSVVKPSYARPVQADALQLKDSGDRLTLQIQRGAEVLQYRITREQLEAMAELHNSMRNE